MGDLYSYASGDEFGLTFCVPLSQGGQFHAALCYDIKITEEEVQFFGKRNDDFSLPLKPLILQKDSSKFVKFLEIVATGLDDEKVSEKEFDFAQGWKEN